MLVVGVRETDDGQWCAHGCGKALTRRQRGHDTWSRKGFMTKRRDGLGSSTKRREDDAHANMDEHY